MELYLPAEELGRGTLVLAGRALPDSASGLRPQVLEAFDRMLTDFTAATGLTADGLEDAEADAALQLPSERDEHPTGYAVDVGIWEGDALYPIDGRGASGWFAGHAARYGFVVRYPVGKEDWTGVASAPWHLRYVGQPHAALMAEKGYCLEEYLDWLRTFAWDARHLRCTLDGTEYELYFVPAESDVTVLPVPQGLPREISGDNRDGYIVTLTREDLPPQKTDADTAPAEGDAG